MHLAVADEALGNTEAIPASLKVEHIVVGILVVARRVEVACHTLVGCLPAGRWRHGPLRLAIAIQCQELHTTECAARRHDGHTHIAEEVDCA